MSLPDPYKVLQVDPEAEDEVIEAAYKRLARKYHPDVSPDPMSVERMVQINQARDMLRDPVRRAAVDRARQRASGTSATVVAGDGKARASRSQASPATHAAPPAPASDGRSDGSPAFPGVQDPNAGIGSSGGASSTWRSNDAGYESSVGGTGSAGLPPGNPSGSLITFGRYDGWTIGEIARTDLEYLEWLDRMPIGRTYHPEIDAILRKTGRRVEALAGAPPRKGILRRR